MPVGNDRTSFLFLLKGDGEKICTPGQLGDDKMDIPVNLQKGFFQCGGQSGRILFPEGLHHITHKGLQLLLRRIVRGIRCIQIIAPQEQLIQLRIDVAQRVAGSKLYHIVHKELNRTGIETVERGRE